jgi:quercetin dioxygenase-like cupin family protein
MSSLKTGPFDLGKTPIHLASTAAGDHPFKPLEWFRFDGASFGRYIAEYCTAANPGRIIMVETMAGDWPTWERHTQGDELVIVLDGSGTFHQDLNGEVRSSPFKAGDTFLNPKGAWHTADVTAPMRAIYITPCPGTENKPRK